MAKYKTEMERIAAAHRWAEEEINNMVRRLLRTIISYDFIDQPPVSDPVAIEEAAKNSVIRGPNLKNISLLAARSSSRHKRRILHLELIDSERDVGKTATRPKRVFIAGGIENGT